MGELNFWFIEGGLQAASTLSVTIQSETHMLVSNMFAIYENS